MSSRFSKSYFSNRAFHRYADILSGKLQQKLAAVEKIGATRKAIKDKIETFKKDKLNLMPLTRKITEQTRILQVEVRKLRNDCVDASINFAKLLFSD